MKKSWFIFPLLVLAGSPALAQFSFTIAPGIGTNSAVLGYQLSEDLEGLFSFTYLGANTHLENTYRDYDGSGNLRTYSYSVSGKAGLLIPSLGVRYTIFKDQDINGYAALSFMKPFLSGSVQEDGVEITEVRDVVNSLNAWGAELGYGMDYALSDQFSFFGEFGLRYFRLKYKQSFDYTVTNPNNNQQETYPDVYEGKLRVNPTYSRIGFRFNF